MESTWVKTNQALAELEKRIKSQLSMLTTIPLTVTQAYILRALYFHDGQRPMDLAHGIGREATAFTPVLDALERAGLIQRHPNTEDRRSIRIDLTIKGRTLAIDVTAILDEVEAEYIK